MNPNQFPPIPTNSHQFPQIATHPLQDQDLDTHNLHTRNFHSHELHTHNLHSQDQDLELRTPIQEAADLWIEALRANPVMWDQTVRGLRKGLEPFWPSQDYLCWEHLQWVRDLAEGAAGV